MKLWETHIRTLGLIYGKDINVHKYLEKMEGAFGSLCEKKCYIEYCFITHFKAQWDSDNREI